MNSGRGLFFAGGINQYAVELRESNFMNDKSLQREKVSFFDLAIQENSKILDELDEIDEEVSNRIQ